MKAQSAGPARLVTEEEITHYRELGWVKLPGFVAPDLVLRLLEIARLRMGSDADSNALLKVTQPFFNPEFGDGLADGSLRPLIERIGTSAKALMGRRADIGVRYFADLFLPKLPASKASKHAGNGETHFHQDFITWALDRSGGMTFWIALQDLLPRAGTMSFVNASHRLGVLGSYRSYDGGDLLDQFPEIRESCTVSEPVAYAAGDATVHSGLCVHGAGANLTDLPRWAYAVIVNPSDARWNGAPAEAYDCAGMRINEVLNDQRFPLIG